MTRSIALFYIARAGDPAWAIRGFFSALAKHPPGVDAKAMLIAKAAGSETLDVIPAPGFQRIDLADSPSVNATFLEAARLVESSHVCVLNSWSRPLAQGWLNLLVEALDADPHLALVGASGSFEAAEGQSFPNLAIRTNGFLCERDLLLASDPGPFSTARDGNAHEAGERSLTRTVLAAGRGVAVVGKGGQAMAPDAWAGSATFRSRDQQNLLIADNRSFDYQSGSTKRRTKLARLAYGDAAQVTPATLAGQISTRLAWRWPEVFA